MINDIAYVGLGISAGQSLQGPELAPSLFYDYAISSELFAQSGRPNFRKKIFQQNELKKEQFCHKIHSRNDLTASFLAPYWRGYELAQDSYLNSSFVVNIGGDHSVAMSMPLSLLLNIGEIGKNFIPWMNSPLKPENLIYLGLRDIDPFEVHMLEKLNIKYISALEIQKIGIHSVLESISHRISDRPLHVSIDVDGLDPHFAPSTGLRIPNGLSVNDVCELMAWTSRQGLQSVDIVEINPNVGFAKDVQQTFLSAAQILFSTLSQQNLYRKNNQGGRNDWIHRAHQEHNSNAFEWCS